MAAQRAAGIDVSHYKKRIDWPKVKASGVKFAIIKASEAESFVDQRFDYNWTRTRRSGIIRGAYHFFRPLVDPAAQVQNFMRVAGQTLRASDLPPVLDVEMYPDFVNREWRQINQAERLRRISYWLEAVEAATGRVPMIYTEYYTWYELMGNTPAFNRYPLWIANYGVEQPKVPGNNWGGKGWWFWQTTDRGVVPGIREEAPCVDMNLFAGTFTDLQHWLKIEARQSLPPEVINSDMLTALIDVADKLSLSSDELISRCGLGYLVDPIGNSLRPYDGPAVCDLPLSEDEQSALRAELAPYMGKNSAVWSITHQDLINAFYQAAALDETGGWRLVTRAGLDYIGEDRGALYNGPVIEDLDGLTDEQKAAILDALGLLEEAEIEAGGETAVIETVELVEEIEVEEELASESLEGQPTYGQEVDNQAVINAFYLTAIRLDTSGREMMSRAGLSGLVNDRLAVYTGPNVESMPNLSAEERGSIAGLLNVDLEDLIVDEILEPVVETTQPAETTHPVEIPAGMIEAAEEAVEPVLSMGNFVEESVVPEGTVPAEQKPHVEQTTTSTGASTYPGLVNQDLINLFYRVAAFIGENGWHWIVRCGLGAIAESREARFESYRGPKLSELPSLTIEQRSALENELSQLSV